MPGSLYLGRAFNFYDMRLKRLPKKQVNKATARHLMRRSEILLIQIRKLKARAQPYADRGKYIELSQSDDYILRKYIAKVDPLTSRVEKVIARLKVAARL